MNNTNKLAIEALRKQIQRIAFDANLWDRGIADYPHAEHCSQKRKQLQAAIAELEGGPTLRTLGRADAPAKPVLSQPELFTVAAAGSPARR